MGTQQTQAPLFHTQVLADQLKGALIPEEQKTVLQNWSNNLAALDTDNPKAQVNAFANQILTQILGYRKILSVDSDFFDGALGVDSPVVLFKVAGNSSFDLDSVSKDNLILIDEARRKAKNMPEAIFFIVTNLDEVRLYSLTLKRLNYESFSLKAMADDPTLYQHFVCLLGVRNMISGITTALLRESLRVGLYDKLIKNQTTIKEIYGPAQQSVNVNIADPFVLSHDTYTALMNEDPRSAEIIAPFYDGEKLCRWHADAKIHWLIYTPKGKVDIEKYPAVKKYLEQFKPQLEGRPGLKWFEIDYDDATTQSLTNMRLGIGQTQIEPGFVLGEKTAQYGSASHFISNADYFLLGLLNSSVIAKLLTDATKQDAGHLQISAEHVESLPVPRAGGQERSRIGRLAQFCMQKAQDRRDLIHHFRGMTAFNLSPKKLDAVLSDRLLNWFAFDFDSFRQEVNASFGQDIPADDLQLWTDYFQQKKDEVFALNSELLHAEAEIDHVIFQLFGLDSDDINLVTLG